MPAEQYRSEAEAIHSITLEAYKPQVQLVTEPGTDVQAPFLLAPKGMQALPLNFDPFREHPVRREGRAVAQTLDSFAKLMQRYEGENSAVFAQRDEVGKNLSLLGVIDYHEAGPLGEARFCRHSVIYKFPLSEEWKAWAAASGVEKTQADFAAFIEERIADVSDPGSASESTKELVKQLEVHLASASRLMELSRGLSIHVNSKLTGTQNTSTGERVLAFSEDHQDPKGAPLKIPGAFLITIPVFHDDGAYPIPVRLTYRVSGGAVLWKVTLYRADRALDHAFKTAVNKVDDAVDCPIYFGSPE